MTPESYSIHSVRSSLQDSDPLGLPYLHGKAASKYGR